MSSNLVKQRYMVVPEEEKRLIDNNERMKRRLDLIRDTLPNIQSESFVSGLDAETVELLPEEDVEDGSVLKAGGDMKASEETARLEAEMLTFSGASALTSSTAVLRQTFASSRSRLRTPDSLV